MRAHIAHGLPQKPVSVSRPGQSQPPHQAPTIQPAVNPHFPYPSGGYGQFGVYQPGSQQAYTGYSYPQQYGGSPGQAYPYYAPQSYPSGSFQPYAQPGYVLPGSQWSYAQASATEEPPHKRIRTSGPDVTYSPSPSAHISADPLAWRNCSHPGCKFVGSGDKVDEHEGDRHLIFRQGRPVERSEEEERYAKHKGPPPPVFGTSITLHTEEDIAKWIAERKAKWPSAKRIAEKEELRKEAIARGENPASHRGRGGVRGRGMRRSDPASKAEDWGRAEPLESDPSGMARGRGRGRGADRGARGRGRGLDRGRGRGGHERNHGGRTESSTGSNTIPVASKSTPVTSTPTAAMPQLAALTGYDSESSSESSSSSSSDSVSDETSSEAEVDEDQETKKEPATSSQMDEETLGDSSSAVVQSAVRTGKAVCNFFRREGRCKFGDTCRYSHILQTDNARPAGLDAAPPPVQMKPPRQPAPKKANPFSRPSMLSQLLANPIQNTLSQLTQTIRFLVANDMLRGVELRPGDADAAAKKRALVQEVGKASAPVSDPRTPQSRLL